MLDTAEPVFRALAEADGAEVPDGAGCWLAPPAAAAVQPAPRVACGPVALGIAGNNQRWVVGTVSYAGSGGSGYQGTFQQFTGIEGLSPGALRRPGGGRPPDVDLSPPTEGVRTQSGRRIVDLDDALVSADASFADAAAAANASIGEDSRCFVAVRETQGRRIALDFFLCGPVLALRAGPGQVWTQVSARAANGNLLVDATFGEVNVTDIGTPVAIPAGTALVRPDGLKPASADLLTGPLATAQEPGFVSVSDVARLSPDASSELRNLRAPADGRLRTPSVTVDLTGVGRLNLLGDGDDALVAADGEEFVIATFDAAVPAGAPNGGASASVVVAGARVPLPDGARLPAKGVVVVSVPTGSSRVDLEVLSEGRIHSVSLVTGARPAGTSEAAYRRTPETGQAASLSLAVPLSAGDPVTVQGAVTSSVVTGWTPDAGYAPDGAAFVTLTVADWDLVTPFGDASVDEVSVGWRLVLPDGQERALAPVPATGTRETTVTFEIPVHLSTADLVADVSVAYTVAGTAATATGSTAPARLELPE